MGIAALGNVLLCFALLCASYAAATGVASLRRPALLGSARSGVYATSALVCATVALLAYAFATHAFQLRYVARYSDRSMPTSYLFASLWGGQDGSLLWWSFLLCAYSTACTWWMGRRMRDLQPIVLATLMGILTFFLVLMLFAANPFATMVSGAPPDGEGLNPLLQNYWMMIHPPSLYLGFVGWSVPFAFAIAALVSGKLDDTWTRAARGWSLIAWLFLSIGLVLGMLWSYEELGWGGYWAWDPVENASFHPWLVGTAYLHSVVVQERFKMLRVWTIVLLCLTYFLTIFGTFLTRSGLIASVHSFARSDIGVYFVFFMGLLALGCTALIVWRLPRLQPKHRIEALLSREFAFLLNNWILLAMTLFVIFATTFPLLSEWLAEEEVSVGPAFYNRWMVPFGILLLFLMGVGPLISWRKATGKKLLSALVWPAGSAVLVAVLHVAFGKALGYPPISGGDAGQKLSGAQWIYAASPVFVLAICVFVCVSIGQEFWRGTAVRMRLHGENPLLALANLVGRARRRYGGYVVHLAITAMYFGFAGSSYDLEREASLAPGDTLNVGDYRLKYLGPRMESDPNKRMVFADIDVFGANGKNLGRLHPAKYIYRTHPQMPTTEVAIRVRPSEDLYVILSTADPQTKRATLRVIVRPWVLWIWLGGLLLVFGVLVALVPPLAVVLSSARSGAQARSLPLALGERDAPSSLSA